MEQKKTQQNPPHDAKRGSPQKPGCMKKKKNPHTKKPHPINFNHQTKTKQFKKHKKKKETKKCKKKTTQT
ncbi:hypothetical protein ACQWHR_24720, partial [Salmonella enterica subsp. enterica serovar Infantis]